jgi:hypothetical protein
MRHKDDSAQENKRHRHDLDHRATRICAPARGMIYPDTKSRIGAVVVDIVLMGIVPMDSARWQGPDYLCLAKARIFIVREISSNGSSTRSSIVGVSRLDKLSANSGVIKLASIRIWLRLNSAY